MFLFNPESAPRPNLAEQLRQEIEREEIARTLFTSGFTKRTHRTNRVRIIDGIPFQQCGGGRRRLSTSADY